MPKRSLMLAGGGLKIAFQAGVLEVLLDEAGLEFDHADAVSAACFNLAMWTQGMSGSLIADNWRNLDPVGALDTHLSLGPKLLDAEGLLDLDRFRSRVFPAWGLDFAAIRDSARDATFNVYNFSKHELRPIPTAELSEDYLIACASLPVWFPPVRIDGDTYIDAILNLPCNVDEAIRRGADEIWVIWTVSQRGEWLNGIVNQFFDIFEATTNHAYKQSLARIARNNAALERGEPAEYGRPIVVREIKSEVPVHYLLNFSRDRAAEAVNRGVEFARAWCAANGIGRGAPGATTVDSPASPGLSFTETARGYFAEGAPNSTDGYERGRGNGVRIELRLEIRIDDLDRFLADPHHAAALSGEIRCPVLGGALPISAGAYNLFTDDGAPDHKKVTYDIALGAGYRLAGTKDLFDDPGRHALSDPATIELEISRDGQSIGRGIARAGALDFLKHLASLRSDAPTLAQKASDVKRFGAFYLGRLWDVYARRVLPVAPF
jgi:predicted patatin/cPLA2 family phospholipase